MLSSPAATQCCGTAPLCLQQGLGSCLSCYSPHFGVLRCRTRPGARAGKALELKCSFWLGVGQGWAPKQVGGEEGEGRVMSG